MISIVIICIVMTSAASSRLTDNDQHTDCRKIQNDCPSLFPEQKHHSSGNPSPVGMVNYTKIKEMIDSCLQEALDMQAKEMSDLLSTLEQSKWLNEDLCPVSYNKKCFVKIIREPGGLPITREQSERICNDRGGKLANIYSEDHYYQLMDYLRTFLPDDKSYMYYWTGMTWSWNSRRTYLSDGTSAPFVKLISSFPWAGSDSNFMAIYVRKPAGSTSQHMANIGSGPAFGAICEI